MSRMNESCHVRMSHVMYDLVISHMNELCESNMSGIVGYVTYG